MRKPALGGLVGVAMQTTTAIATVLAPLMGLVCGWIFKRPRQALQRWIHARLPARVASLLTRPV